MLTELVTNAVRHGEGAERPRGVAVKVVESDGGVGAAVTNPGAGFEWSGRESDDPLEPGGYGLVLVDSHVEPLGHRPRRRRPPRSGSSWTAVR